MSAVSVGAAVEALRTELHSVFGTRLRALLLYGPHLSHDEAAPISEKNLPHSLALVDSLTFDDLGRCASLSAAWARRRQPPPLIVPMDEFRRSLDAFPLEYGDIIAHHIVVAGANPFEGMEVKQADIRRACEVQAHSHLLHLRQGYLECAGRPPAIADLITASARPLRGLLAHVARLDGVEPNGTDALVGYAETRIGVSGHAIRQVLGTADSGTLAGGDAESLYRPYLQAMERLAAYVDSWRGR